MPATSGPRNPALGPVKPPNWRYLLAQQAAAEGRVVLPSEADETTRQLARYLRKERQCTYHTARRQLRRKNRPIATALDIHGDPSRETAVLLESLVLAREPTGAIAARCGISRAAVAWYRRCFFSVSGWLDNVHCIMQYAIRPELGRGGGRAGRHYVMKLLSFFCGAKVLDEFLRSGHVSARQQWEKPATFLEKLAASADLRMAVALVESPNLTPGNHPDRLRKWLEQVIDRVRASTPDAWPQSTIERTTWETNAGGNLGPRLAGPDFQKTGDEEG